MSLRYDFMPAATAPENQPPVAELEDDRHPDLERRFWKNVCLQPPLYGADVEGTLFDKDLKVTMLRPPTPFPGRPCFLPLLVLVLTWLVFGTGLESAKPLKSTQQDVAGE